MKGIKKSVLDLAVVPQGGNATLAIERTVANAQNLEALGYERFWLAEHHNMSNIASSATSLLISHVAAHTNTIRVGSGGIMLPNHSPLAIAEAFGTLDILYPGRIDLGLGRAPGTDQLTAMALRRQSPQLPYDFKANIEELQAYFGNKDPRARVRAFPGEGASVPIWILGSSTDSAYLAAAMGLPYAFACHFAPAQLIAALNIYYNRFQPSKALAAPYAMACVNAIAADTDEEADYLSTSLFQLFKGIVTNQRMPLAPPVSSLTGILDYQEEAAVRQMLTYSFFGSKKSLQEKLSAFVDHTKISEIMFTSTIYDAEARDHSFKLLHELAL